MLALIAQTTNTTNTMNEKEATVFLAGFGIFLVIMILVALVTFALSIWMLVDAFGRNEEDFPMGGKAIWIVVLILGIFLGYGLFSAIVYYFVVKRKAGKTSEIKKSP